jgi:predicted DNA-binding protein YlxM (UPF0122 family)
MESVTKLSADEVMDLESEVSVPYRVEDATVLSEGQWNGLQWTAQELREAVNRTDFNMDQQPGDQNPPNASLFYDHDDRSADMYVGKVENVRMEGDDVVSDLVITDKQAAMNLEYGAPFGVSPKADGMVDDQNKMQDFEFENFSLVINPAVKTTWLNEDITSVLEDLSVHRPKYREVGDSEFDAPSLKDFVGHSNYSELSEEQKTAIGKHFLVSKSGFPADQYTDYALPVVTTEGELNRSALQQAKSRVSQVSGIEDSEIERVEKLTDNLANGNFDADFGDDRFVSMQEMSYEVHKPEFDGLAPERDWSRPDLEDFDVSEDTYSELPDDEKEMIEEKFVLSSSGFPAENYGDLSLPVVFPDGELSLSALGNAKARASQVEGIDSDTVLEVQEMLTEMANSNFEDASFDEVDMAEDMPVGEDDWVQWEPEEGFEAHGKVIRVIEPDSEDGQLKVDIRMYVQDDDGVWHPTGDVRRKDMDEVGPWGNTPSDDAISDERLEDITNASPVRKFDPDKEDQDEISDSISDAIENEDTMELISDSQEKAIESKVEEHNEKHGDEEGKKVTKTMLKKVYNRGMGAYEDTHRPGMSAQQWSMARVNAFLYLVRNGNPENDAYTQDNDLLPDGHPKKGESESSEKDVMVKNPMAEENQEPKAEEASEQEEETVEDYVTADELEDFKSEVVDSLKQELGDEEEEEAGNSVEESEAPDTELSEFEEFRKQNPDMSLSEAAEKFEESNKDVEEKIDEVTQMFEEKISDLEEKLEEKDEEVEELSEKVANPQRATQASGDEEGPEDLREEVSELSDEELHAQIFSQMNSDSGVSATKEMMFQ